MKAATSAANITQAAALLEIGVSFYLKAAFKHPQLFYQSPGAVSTRVTTLAALTGLTRRECIAAGLRNPSLLHVDPATLNAKIEETANHLRVEKSIYLRAIRRQPCLLNYHSDTLAQNLATMVAAMGLPRDRYVVAAIRQPLAGRGLVLGADKEGETVSARSTLDELKCRVLHLRIINNDPVTFITWRAADPSPQPGSWLLEEVLEWTQDWPSGPAPPTPILH